jgi:hypothetical protein
MIIGGVGVGDKSNEKRGGEIYQWFILISKNNFFNSF